MYAVILAGGGGTRLRPVSTADRPKPFLPLLPDGRTLIRRTVDRLPAGLSGAWVVVGPAHADLVRAQVPDAGVVLEPAGRNTAAAIALAALAIDRPADEVMAVLPADHLIAREQMFADVLAAAGRIAAESHRPLVTLGIEMTRPATEYGYLVPTADPGGSRHGLTVHRLAAFREKPDAAGAAELFARGGGIAWNAGMFLWQRGAIVDALRAYTPLPLDSEAALRMAYPALSTRSIDYEVMEPAAADGRVVMASMDVGWDDIGGWSALLGALGIAGSGRVVEAGQAVSMAADDLLVRAAPAGGLELASGPGTILVDTPSAHLVGVAGHRHVVQDLLDRVAAAEARVA